MPIFCKISSSYEHVHPFGVSCTIFKLGKCKKCTAKGAWRDCGESYRSNTVMIECLACEDRFKCWTENDV